MLKASVVAVCAALITLTGPADACGWKRDGMGWRSAGVGYGYRDGTGYRSYRPWLGAGYGWRGNRYGWGGRRYGYGSGVTVGLGFRDGWRHRRHWRGDGYGYRSGVAVGVRSGDRWDRGRRWRGEGYGWRADRSERRGLFRDRRVEADVVAK